MIITTTRKIVGDTRSFCAEWSAIPSNKYDPSKLSINQYAYSEKDIPSDFYKKHNIFYVDFTDHNRLVKAYELEDAYDQITFIDGDVIGVAGTVTTDKFLQYLADIIAKLADRVTALENANTDISAQLEALEEFIRTHDWSSGGDTTPEEPLDEDAQFIQDLYTIDDEYLNFLLVYNNALSGISTVPMSDSHSFVSIYELAYLSSVDVAYTDDSFLFVQAYNDAFGGFDIVSELELLFGIGPHTFVEAYDTKLSDGLANLPYFTGTLPTYEELGEINPYITTFKDIYDTALGTATSNLPVAEGSYPDPNQALMFDVIYDNILSTSTDGLPS